MEPKQFTLPGTVHQAMRVIGQARERSRRTVQIPSGRLRLARSALTAIFLFALVLPVLAGESDLVKRFTGMGWTKTDFGKKSIPLDEIFSGGVPRDAIPAINSPKFVPLNEITGIMVDDREPVISLKIGDDARAYPLSVMTWHEIVNDTVGGVPVAVTYCPLCNSAIVFERKVGGKLLDFGTTGLLRNSDLVMYDRQTHSWWQQFTGEAIIGKYTGQKLKFRPARLEAFGLFKKRFRKGKVLVPANPALRDYGRNPYVRYDSSAKPFLYNGSMPKGIHPMKRVIVFKNNGKVHVYALALLAKKTQLKAGDAIVKWAPGQASALDSTLIAQGRDVGNITVQIKHDGKLEDIPYEVTFAFVAHAFHPDITIVTE